MAKAKSQKTQPSGVGKTPIKRGASAAALQGQIARLDVEIVKLVQDRAKLVLEMAQTGGAPGDAILASGLALEAIGDLLDRAKGPLPKQSLEVIFCELLGACRLLVKKLRISFLGPLYSFSHVAALRRFGQSVEMAPVGSIAAVFEEVDRGQSDFGLVPVENSTDGRIADTLDMFTRLPIRICGEVEMRIHHTLLGKCPRTDVQEVYSKPQALSQCRNWLARHLPAARTIEVTSTTTAAQLAKEKPGAAAIASMEAAIHYSLDVLAENIEDNPSNTTRFAVIGGKSPPRTGNDRTAMLFQVEHRPGTLAEAMNIFKRNQINLTWIESFPVPNMERTYLFFVEMEGHESDSRLRRAVKTLQRKALRLEMLGSFPATHTIE
jgi:chorismate mutase / prephenate dehydratase